MRTSGWRPLLPMVGRYSAPFYLQTVIVLDVKLIAERK